jgi:hypothetical protein
MAHNGSLAHDLTGSTTGLTVPGKSAEASTFVGRIPLLLTPGRASSRRRHRCNQAGLNCPNQAMMSYARCGTSLPVVR